MTTTFVLQENVLTNNVLIVADDGYVFRGGIKAIVKEYVYANSWSDKEIVKRFKNLDTLQKYLSKNYPSFDLDEVLEGM